MKFLTFLLLISIHSLSWSQKIDVSELGRSLANYQACSKVAVSINDDAMASYYQTMFNDATISMLSINTEGAKFLYSEWEKSEKVLSNIESQSLQKMCLSRFDDMSRRLFNKVATQ